MPENKISFFSRTFSTLALWGFILFSLYISYEFIYIGIISLFLTIAYLEYKKIFSHLINPRYPLYLIVLTYIYLIIFCLFISKNEKIWSLYDVGFTIFVFILITVLTILNKNINNKERFNNCIVVFFGWFYLTINFSFIQKIAYTNPAVDNVIQANTYVIFIILVTKLTDTGAYLVGSWIGKHKAIPYISKAKSWEGYIGGVIIATISGLIYYYLFGENLKLFSVYDIIWICPVIAIFTIFGDLFESVLKRSQEIKDSSSILPGIGGILDLIDSLCFTIPVFYFIIVIKKLL